MSKRCRPRVCQLLSTMLSPRPERRRKHAATAAPMRFAPNSVTEWHDSDQLTGWTRLDPTGPDRRGIDIFNCALADLLSDELNAPTADDAVADRSIAEMRLSLCHRRYSSISLCCCLGNQFPRRQRRRCNVSSSFMETSKSVALCVFLSCYLRWSDTQLIRVFFIILRISINHHKLLSARVSVSSEAHFIACLNIVESHISSTLTFKTGLLQVAIFNPLLTAMPRILT